MTHLNDTMPTNLLAIHRKYAHLTKEERVMIATLKSQGLSNRAIGRQLGPNIPKIVITPYSLKKMFAVNNLSNMLS